MSAATTTNKPNYIYKLVPAASPVPLQHSDLPEHLPVSDIDRSSGFIHMSTSVQVPGTLKFFFKDDPLVYVLRIRYDDLDDKIRWEDPKAEVCGPRGGEGMFPHIYNGLQLGKAEIERVEIMENLSLSGQGGWDAAIEKANADWLVW